MHREPAVRDSSFNRRAIFLVAATGTDELCVDHGDRQSPGMIGLHRIRQLKQFLLGGVRRRERSRFLEFHLGCMIAMPWRRRGVARLYGIGACHAPLMMISGFSMTF